MSAVATAAYSPIARPSNESIRPHGSIWPHLPWIAGLILTPLWYGGVNATSQSVLSLLLSVSLLASVFRLRWLPQTFIGKLFAGGFLALALIMLIPLPAAFVKLVQPETWKLAETFKLGTEPPRFVALSLSPGSTLLRLWQLAMFAAAFLLAREAVQTRRFATVLSTALCGAVFLLASSEIWFLVDGHGIWKEVRNYPAGTFANRSHFANWMAVASVFLLGPLIRRIAHRRREDWTSKDIFLATVIGLAVLLGASLTVACGSRGGVMALGAGILAWAAILVIRGDRGIGAAVFGVLILATVLGFALSGELFTSRMGQGGLDFKLRIWKDALAMAARFPLTGVGIGAFRDGFNHYKTFHGEGTFLFAENEPVQWIVETGIVGLLLALLPLLLLARNLPGKADFRSDIFAGAIAALVAFSAHACFEFVGQVPATALLAAVLLGMAAGIRAKAGGPRVRNFPGRAETGTTLCFALLLAFIAGRQAIAKLSWEEARLESNAPHANRAFERALDLWPFEPKWALEYVRRNVASGLNSAALPATLRSRVEAELNRSLKLHPYDWELRLEQAWLSLAFTPNPASRMKEVNQVIQLNPLQPRIPLRFANTLAVWNPEGALGLILSAPVKTTAEVTEALQSAWRIQRNPAILWQVTPATREGLFALSEFAERNGLPELAEEARRIKKP